MTIAVLTSIVAEMSQRGAPLRRRAAAHQAGRGPRGPKQARNWKRVRQTGSADAAPPFRGPRLQRASRSSSTVTRHFAHEPEITRGPMQFLPATFAGHARPVPPGGADPPSPYDPVDAVHAAARYLCASGARAGDLRAALYAYNRSTAYVASVLAVARRYAAAAAPADAGDAAAKAVAFARAQLGVPYVWGGDGPAEGGFDCSGLTRAAYATAGTSIPRTADTQWRHGPAIPAGQPLQPGDLLFYGTPARATHVTLYVGANTVVHAPYQARPVQYATVWTDGFLGATRPTANN